MAERPDTRQLTIDDCADLSRRVSDKLDALEAEGRDPIEGGYRLEVSSPGIDRPLTRPIDFDLFEGEEARLETDRMIEGRKRFKGVLAGYEDGNVLIDLDGEEDTALIPFDWLSDAKLVLTDELIREMLRQKKEAGVQIENLDPSAFDEIETEDNDGENADAKE